MLMPVLDVLLVSCTRADHDTESGPIFFSVMVRRLLFLQPRLTLVVLTVSQLTGPGVAVGEGVIVGVGASGCVACAPGGAPAPIPGKRPPCASMLAAAKLPTSTTTTAESRGI